MDSEDETNENMNVSDLSLLSRQNSTRRARDQCLQSISSLERKMEELNRKSMRLTKRENELRLNQQQLIKDIENIANLSPNDQSNIERRVREFGLNEGDLLQSLKDTIKYLRYSLQKKGELITDLTNQHANTMKDITDELVEHKNENQILKMQLQVQNDKYVYLKKVNEENEAYYLQEMDKLRSENKELLQNLENLRRSWKEKRRQSKDKIIQLRKDMIEKIEENMSLKERLAILKSSNLDSMIGKRENTEND